MNDLKFAKRMKKALAGMLAVGLVLTGMPGFDAEAANEIPGRTQQEQTQPGQGNGGTDNLMGNDISGNGLSGKEQPGDDGSGNEQTGNDISGNDISGNDLAAAGEETVEEEAGGRVVGGYIELPEDRDVSVVDESARIHDYGDEIAPLLSDSLPAQYIPDKGTLPLTRDQNPYGSCWAHSAMALAEIDMRKNEGASSDADYSELHLAYFSYNGAVNDPLGGLDGDANRGVYDADAPDFMQRGGNLSLAQYVLLNWVGAADERIAPYSQAADAVANGLSPDIAFTDAAHLQNAFRINLQENRNIAKRMILQYGGVGTSYCDADQFYNADHKSYYCGTQYKTNHAVIIVGWDDSFSADQFNTKPEGDGAWLIRNSWSAGKDTDDRSRYTYFWMSYYDKSMAAGYAFDFESADHYHHNYQYDGSMHTAGIGYESGSIYGANVFTAKACEGGERLEAVGLAFYEAQTPYTVFVYKNLENAADPESGTLITEAVISGTCGCEGFYTIPLSAPVNLAYGNTFSVVVKIGPFEENSAVWLPYEKSADTWYQCETAAKTGQSFYRSEAGSWIDFGKEKNANLRIKAYTVDAGGGAVLPADIQITGADVVTAGETITLQAVCSPSDAEAAAVKWSSSDERVLTVDSDGVVTGIAPGYASITAEIGETSDTKRIACEFPAFSCRASLAEGGISLTWKGGSGVKSYQVYRAEGADWTDPTLLAAITETGKEEYSYLDQSVTDGNQYIYEVQAIVNYIDGDAVKEKTVSSDRGSVTMPVRVPDKTLESGVLTMQSESFLYTGAAQEPAVTVMAEGVLLEEGRDYTVTYQNNKDVGTASVTAEGIGDYHGSLSRAFAITPAKLTIRAKDKTISVGDKVPEQSDYEYEVSGLLMDDRLLREPEFQCGVSETGTQKAGQFTITPSAADAGPNYTIAYEAGRLTVEGSQFRMQEIEDVFYYTGKAWKPAVAAYDGDTLLKAGRDYTVRYVNNIDANAGGVWKKGNGRDADFNPDIPYVQIIGKGNYTDEIKVNFDIRPAEIADTEGGPAAKVVFKYTDQFAAADKELKPFGSIKYGKVMKAGQDYALALLAKDVRDGSGKTVPAGKKFENAAIPAGYAGEFTLTVTGVGNYAGMISRSVYVTDQNHLMKNAKITLGKNQKSVALVGEQVELTPSTENSADTFTVKLGTIILTPGRDYQVSYLNESNRRVGKATLVITGAGDYSGTKTAAFTVKGKAFTAGKVTVTGMEDKVYTGGALTQKAAVLIYNAGGPDEKKLTYGKDYVVTYAKNTDKGTAVMTFTGSPEQGFSGSFKKTFKILADDITKVKRAAGWNTIVAKYSKAGAKPVSEIVLTNADGIRLQPGRDYSLAYRNNRLVADAADEKAPTVVVKGRGNYQGSFSIPFTIEKADLRSGIESGAITVKTTAMAFRPDKPGDYSYQPAVKLTEGKKALQPGRDYTVSYHYNTQADYQAYIDSQGKSGIPVPAPQAVIEAGPDSPYLISGKPEASIVVPLTIYRSRLTKANLRVEVNESDCEYTGMQVKPEPIVYYKGEAGEKTLVKDTDYTVSYGANVMAGKKAGSLTIHGRGTLYGGDVTVTFEISRKKIKQ